jgi:uncharacterized delta-60 repeat protein
MYTHRTILFLLALSLSTILTIAGPVTLDTSFNTTGYRVQFLISDGSVGESVAFQPDGKIVLGGWTRSIALWGSFAVMRLNTNGGLDSSFDGDGIAITTVANFNRGDTIRIQPDGKILLAGNRYFGNTNNDFTMLRYNLDGTLDNTFDGNGIAAPNTSGFWDDYAYDMALQPDGKLVLVGTTAPTTTIGETLPTDIAIMRVTSAGAPDSTFNSTGIVIVRFTGVSEGANAVAIQSDGRIVMGGFLNNTIKDEFLLMRFHPNGQLDTTFGSNGITFNSVSGGNDRINSLVLQSDGKILAAGGSFIARYTNSGTIDSSFGQNGVVTAPHSVREILTRPDDRFLAVGGGVSVSRFNANGSLDTSFNSTGSVSAGVSGSSCVGNSVAQKDNLIAVGGNCTSGGQSQFSVFRFVERESRKAPYDFDGDGKTDLSIFRPSSGQWWLNRSTAGLIVYTFGNSADKIVPGDYTGDGKTDVAIYRPSGGEWFVLRSEDSSFYSFPFGAADDIPVPGDYDGDGKTDAAVFRASTATWFIKNSGGGTTIQNFGAPTDLPVAADYDGDGKTDIAIYRASSGQWWLNRSAAGLIVFTFGTATDRTVPGDYTGDGKADVAFFRPSSGEWFILRSENASFYSFPFGATGDLPVPGDFDGDGKFDPGVFRPTGATWFVQQSTAGTLIQNFGASTDLPIPNSGVRN